MLTLEKIKNITSLIKNYTPIIALLAPTIGGFFQILELWKIGTPFIRFFSVTQLISDTIIIGVIVGSLLLFNKIAQILSNKTGHWIIFIISIFVVIGVIKNYYIDQLPLLIVLGYILVTFMCINGLKNLLITLVRKTIDKEKMISVIQKIGTYIRNNDWLFVIIIQTGIIGSLYILIGALSIIGYFYNLGFNLSNELVNIKIMEDRVKGQFNTDQVSFLYLNDNYIFLSVGVNTERKVIIYKFDDLLLESRPNN